MNGLYSPLLTREVFHIEFLRWLCRKIKAKQYALKGGANLRFFFNSFRYSEDMDLDACYIEKYALKDAVMQVLESRHFQDNLKAYGIERVVPPDINKAKQTETTQRFKVHLVTYAGEDLFTKIEFSRRGFKGQIIVQQISDAVLRAYKLPPLLVPHYDIYSAITQKIDAICARPVIQARDIFDLYILSSQYEHSAKTDIKLSNDKFTKAYENIFTVSFMQFRDTVISYLSSEDQAMYNNESSWDEVKLKASDFIKELRKGYA